MVKVEEVYPGKTGTVGIVQVVVKPNKDVYRKYKPSQETCLQVANKD
jgi:hypothetical protein